jgi:tetratricopeptide (TPR) repeat protein
MFGDFEKGDKLAKELVNNNFTDYTRLFEIALQYYFDRMYDKAIQFSQLAFSHLDTSDTGFKLNLTSFLGACNLEKEDYEQAHDLLKKALEIDPKDQISIINLAKVYVAQNKKTEAKMILQQAINDVGPYDEQNKRIFIDLLEALEEK